VDMDEQIRTKIEHQLRGIYEMEGIVCGKPMLLGLRYSGQIVAPREGSISSSSCFFNHTLGHILGHAYWHCKIIYIYQ